MFGIFGFLGFILILIIFIVFIILAFLGNIARSIFSLGKRTPKHFHGEKTSSTTQDMTSTSSNEKKKIFSDDEGEYVEFEEVK